MVKFMNLFEASKLVKEKNFYTSNISIGYDESEITISWEPRTGLDDFYQVLLFTDKKIKILDSDGKPVDPPEKSQLIALARNAVLQVLLKNKRSYESIIRLKTITDDEVSKFLLKNYKSIIGGGGGHIGDMHHLMEIIDVVRHQLRMDLPAVEAIIKSSKSQKLYQLRKQLARAREKHVRNVEGIEELIRKIESET